MPGPVPNPGVARLWSHGAPQGAGLLAAPRTVLTCGHVVSAVAGEHESVPLPLGLTVQLDFPLADPTARRQAATLIRHVPVAADGTGDIAVLSLAEEPPAGVEPLRLLDVRTVRDHPFKAFGFPAGDDGGVWSSGRIVDDRGRGWVQIESTGACEILQGFSGSPLWDDRLKCVVGMVVATDQRFLGRAAYAITADVLIEAHPELRRYATLSSPFRGLMPFREQDAAHYFGRSVQTAELTEAVTTSVVVPVVGASGVGKSSLVQAGLVPALRRRGDYSVATLVPEPAVRVEYMLASALLPLLGEEAEPRARLEQLEGLANRLRDAGALAPTVKEALSRTGTSQLLLFIDQFEVLFRCAPEAADALVEQALHMTGWRTADGGPLVRLVFTLRMDFLTSMRRFPALERACETSAFFVNKLSGEQLREVVLSPVDSFHGAVQFEERLAERLLSDAGRSPGALPLLEFALTLLWERQLQGVLTHAAYEEIGRVAGALATHAERAVKERLGDLTDEVRRLFVQLVRPGDAAVDADADAPLDTGRTARRPELSPACWEAAQLLAVQRLVHLDHASDGVETVSLAHEALLEHWPTLRSWVDMDRDFRTWQEHLRARIARWEPGGRERALLMRGSELKKAEQWLRDRQEDIPEDERDYIRASAEWRRRRRFRGALAATAVVLAMAGLAGASLSSVRDNRAAELASGLVQEAQRQANSRLEPAALLSVAAWRTASTQQARDNLFDRYLSDARYDAVLPANGAVAETALDDSGRLIAVRTDAGRLTVWRRSAQPNQTTQVAQMDGVSAVAVSPDGTRLALGGDGNRIRIWDVAGRKVVLTLQGAASTASADQKVDQLAFDRTGRRLVAHPPEEDTAQVWDLDRPTAPATRLQPPSGTEGSAGKLAFDASGEHVVSDHVGGRLEWDARTGRFLKADDAVGDPGAPAVWFVQGPHPVVAQCLDTRWHLTDPVGGGTDTRVAQSVPCATGDEVAGVSDQLILGRRANTVTVYDAHSGAPLTKFTEDGASGGRYTRYCLTNGSRTFALARGTEALTVSAPEPGSLETVSWINGSQPTGKEGDAERSQFSPSGRYLATVAVGGPVTVWDPSTGRRFSAVGAGMDGNLVHAVFDPAEKTLAVSDMTEPTVTLYSLPGLRVIRRLHIDLPDGTPPEAASIAGLGFGPQNRLTILAGGAVSQWDTTTGRRIGQPLLFGGAATAMAVNPDSGAVAVTTPDRRGIEVWDVPKRRRTDVLVPGFTAQLLDWYRAVQYSADGKRLMLVGQNGETEIRDTATGRRLIAIPAAPSRYTAFLAHSDQVVSMRSDAFEVWGPEGLVARTRTPPNAQVRAVVPSPDGEHMLLTTGKDLDVRFLLGRATPDAWAASLCSRVTRNISRSDMGTVHYGILERSLLGVTACASRG